MESTSRSLDPDARARLRRFVAIYITFSSHADPRLRVPVGDHGDHAATISRDFPKMSGANIRNAAVSAAFLAAADRASTICQNTLVRAARAEYRSMGHVLSERRRRDRYSVRHATE